MFTGVGRGEPIHFQGTNTLNNASMWPRPWGRGERRGGRWKTLRFRGFNVATTLGSWRTGPPGRRKTPGPRFNVATTLGSWRTALPSGASLPIESASMWPRPWGRGERGRQPEAASIGPRLQCGHDPGVVENPRDEDESLTREERFNVATTLGSWRTHLFDLERFEALVASMWPRPWGRGERGVLRVERQQGAASMWPRPWGRGEPDPLRRRGRSAHASMWPRPWGRGERGEPDTEAA